MKISIIKNAPFEEPGMITEWIELRGHEYEVHEGYLGDLPELGTFDFLILLGGPASVNDELPWIINEKKLIKASIEKGIYIFGICLGAQLIAAVLGSKIKRNEHDEIGWHPIKCTHNFLKKEMTVFHWHSDTFNLPAGADLLASSEACEIQAFAFSDSVLALQFHLEMNSETIEKMISNCGFDLKQSRYVQNEKELKSQTKYFADCKEELFDLLDGFEIRFQS